MIRQLARILFPALTFAALGFGANPANQAAAAGSTDEGMSLPSWLTLGFELRGRAETLTSPTFEDGTSQSHYLHRLRIDVGVRPATWLRLHGRLQDSRVAGWDKPVTPGSVRNTVEIGEAFAAIGTEEGPGWGAIAGRQPLVFGAMRVLSTSNWGNVGPRWDGLRVSHQSERLRIDLFAAAPVEAVNGKLDRWFAPGRRAFGLYGVIGRVPTVDRLEPYAVAFTYRPALGETGKLGARRFAAFGARVVDRINSHFDYEMEWTGQAGTSGGDEIRAWGVVAEIGYRPFADPESPRLFGRYQYATGDQDPSDGRSDGFQHMYATDKWGTADAVAWRNVHQPLLGLSWTPSGKFQLLVRASTLWLASRADALYATSGAAMAYHPDASSSHVGEEADFRIVWQALKPLQLYGGYGYFFPARFLEESTPGAGRHLLYIMWTLRL